MVPGCFLYLIYYYDECVKVVLLFLRTCFFQRKRGINVAGLLFQPSPNIQPRYLTWTMTPPCPFSISLI
jgi:hypothetical protein